MASILQNQPLQSGTSLQNPHLPVLNLQSMGKCEIDKKLIWYYEVDNLLISEWVIGSENIEYLTKNGISVGKLKRR